MTTIDGTRAPGTIPADGPTLDRVDELSRILGRSPAEVVGLAVAEFAPPVERPPAPGAGEGAGASTTPAPTIATTLPPACPDCGERSIHEECP